ncbi:MAG: hypothetical protein IT291_05855 [Deltaproteobacteria bacterium]|nr:hypothetical protein [Deltaproteobacteria bacterium]
MSQEIREIFERVTESYSFPIRVGSRCEAKTFYRVESLTRSDLETCAAYVAERIIKVCYPQKPEKLINLPGGYTAFAEVLSKELCHSSEPLEVLSLSSLNPNNGGVAAVRQKRVVLVNDVITTARSCLEAHSKMTIMGANVMCWAALVDRTFGPGPVPVVAAFTGDPVTLLEPT